MNEITDEMVEAALSAKPRYSTVAYFLNPNGHLTDEGVRELMRAALTCALAARPAPEAGSVVERDDGVLQEEAERILREVGWSAPARLDLFSVSRLMVAMAKRTYPAAAIAERDERIERLERERDEARDYAFEATTAITGLTVGGSEFFAGKLGDQYKADLPYCVKHIRVRIDDTFEQFKKAQMNCRHWREEAGKINARVVAAEARVDRLEKALHAMLKEHDILSGNFGDVMDPKHQRPDRWPNAASIARAALQQEGESDA